MSLSSIIGRKMQSKKMSAGTPLRSSRKKGSKQNKNGKRQGRRGRRLTGRALKWKARPQSDKEPGNPRARRKRTKKKNRVRSLPKKEMNSAA